MEDTAEQPPVRTGYKEDHIMPKYERRVLSRLRHRETGSDEIFFGNYDEDGYAKIKWSTKRRGKVAYGVNGRSLHKRQPSLFPVFVHMDEVIQSGLRIPQFA